MLCEVYKSRLAYSVAVKILALSDINHKYVTSSYQAYIQITNYILCSVGISKSVLYSGKKLQKMITSMFTR